MVDKERRENNGYDTISGVETIGDLMKETSYVRSNQKLVKKSVR